MGFTFCPTPLIVKQAKTEITKSLYLNLHITWTDPDYNVICRRQSASL